MPQTILILEEKIVYLIGYNTKCPQFNNNADIWNIEQMLYYTDINRYYIQ